ncbi:MAG: AraC family transcriptional regulator [Shimia sp.]
MRTHTFHLDSYVRPDESHHIARKTLAPAPSPRHTHDFYELFLVERGTVDHWINGRAEVLPRGALVFVRPRDVHAVGARDAAGAQIVNVMFRTGIADHLRTRYGADFAGRFFWTTGAMPSTHLLTGPRFERAVNQSLQLMSAPRSLVRVEGFLLAVMNTVVEVFDQSAHALPPWLRLACERARLPEVFRLGAAGFVAAAGRGHEHVARQTKAHLGVTPTGYVNRMRMEYAALVLAGSAQPIPDVAEACGIETLSHFYRLFRSHYGVTPRAYRLQHQRSPV